MAIHAFFPTHVYTSALDAGGSRQLNRDLLRESKQLRDDDTSGRRWSAKNYPGGYTSYGSVHRLQEMSPTFATLRRKLARHVKTFSAALDWDLAGRELQMTDCWVNIMSHRTVHGLHLHPLASLSGTYYVQTPPRCSGIKFEDPRLERFMAAPPRAADARRDNKPWITVPAAAGQVVLFESWLRHEVAPNPGSADRVSVSFNYNWF